MNENAFVFVHNRLIQKAKVISNAPDCETSIINYWCPINRNIPQALGDRTAVQTVKQNFPLRYFYGESANAIKIQIGVTLIANLLLMVMQKQLQRPWSFSGLATMVRITLMDYVDFYSLFNFPEKDWEDILAKTEQRFMEQLLLFG